MFFKNSYCIQCANLKKFIKKTNKIFTLKWIESIVFDSVHNINMFFPPIY